jgi:hypothetical protein
MRLVTAIAAGVLLALLGAAASGVTFVRAGPGAPSPLSGDLSRARGGGKALRVLFIGDSLTYENGMPALLEGFVASDPFNEPLIAVSYTPGNQTFAQDTTDPTVDTLLHEVDWDIVVLQERSAITVLDSQYRALYMDAPAAELVSKIRAIGAEPIFFATWGDRTGTLPYAFDSYDAMQGVVTRNYYEVALPLHVYVMPIDSAWREALKRRPNVPLWAPDGHHPSRLGAYLNAAVFYGFLYLRNPASSFLGGLTEGEATFLQSVARDPQFGP